MLVKLCQVILWYCACDFAPQLWFPFGVSPYSFWNSGLYEITSLVYDDEKLISVLPAFPFLVVTNITPFAAWLPYNAAAEAPSSTVMLSISSGLRFDIPSPPSGEPP